MNLENAKLFFDALQETTPLGVWFLPVALSAVLFLVLVLALFLTSEARKVKYRFITVGSHKLRTPLSKIKAASAELIHKKEGADARREAYTLDDYDERMLRQIAIENSRLVGLVNLLLEVSESEEGHPKYNRTVFDIVKLTQEILEGYQNSQWRNDRAFIEFESTNEALFVKADRQRISSVIQVFLENAITYSPSGGKILVLLEKHGRKLTFCISDSGIGIISKERKYIFQKFYRSARALRIDTEGTGIGLFLAKHIIGGHGGKMWFTSGGGYKGSSFFFTLPLTTVSKTQPKTKT